MSKKPKKKKPKKKARRPTKAERAQRALRSDQETLARMDTVAYVRFASVYKNFQEADDFETFVHQLRPPEDARGKGAKRKG